LPGRRSPPAAPRRHRPGARSLGAGIVGHGCRAGGVHQRRHGQELPPLLGMAARSTTGRIVPREPRRAGVAGRDRRARPPARRSPPTAPRRHRPGARSPGAGIVGPGRRAGGVHQQRPRRGRPWHRPAGRSKPTSQRRWPGHVHRGRGIGLRSGRWEDRNPRVSAAASVRPRPCVPRETVNCLASL
jgi:hypothetical protein